MASSSVHDPAILDALSAIEPVSLETSVYRAVFAGRDPTVGSLAGGRWSPPQSFEALYTSFDAECSIAEVLFHLKRQSIFPQRAVELHTLAVVTERTVDLSTNEACEVLGLDDAALTSMNFSLCQDIGHAAEFLGYDSLRVRSARCDTDNLVIIIGHLTHVIKPIDFEVVDWSKYR